MRHPVTNRRVPGLYFVKARRWERRRGKWLVRPTVVRCYCDGWAELSRVVLWLEVDLGFDAHVHRLAV